MPFPKTVVFPGMVCYNDLSIHRNEEFAMFLTKEKIRSLSVGAAAVYEEEKGLRFAKCTSDQLAAWKEAMPHIYSNAVGSTGVRLDFCTDSDFVTVTTGEAGKYEIKINGLIHAQYIAVQTEDGIQSNTFTIRPGSGINRITISLPSHGAGGVISSVEIADNSFCERHRFDRKILFLGDSITQGWNCKYDSMSYAYLVSDSLNADSIIQGIGGAVFAPSTILPMDFTIPLWLPTVPTTGDTTRITHPSAMRFTIHWQRSVICTAAQKFMQFLPSGVKTAAKPR